MGSCIPAAQRALGVTTSRCCVQASRLSPTRSHRACIDGEAFCYPRGGQGTGEARCQTTLPISASVFSAIEIPHFMVGKPVGKERSPCVSLYLQRRFYRCRLPY